jgi:hypothetical protein
VGLEPTVPKYLHPHWRFPGTIFDGITADMSCALGGDYVSDEDQLLVVSRLCLTFTFEVRGDSTVDASASAITGFQLSTDNVPNWIFSQFLDMMQPSHPR